MFVGRRGRVSDAGGRPGRVRRLAQRWVLRLAEVVGVPPGRPRDGLTRIDEANPGSDRSWEALSVQLRDALEAWRKNPLARRIIGLTTSYVVGDGITLTSEYGPLKRYLAAWWNDPQNLLDLRLGPWCDELARAGELFVVLHFNPADGISYVRLVAAGAIDRIIWRPGDYEAELEYHETVGQGDPDYERGGRLWCSPLAPEVDEPLADGRYRPVMLHFAVNRPAGCTRGEGDLAPILPWLRQYAQWLEDRVRLNAAVRSFLWVVKVPKGEVETRSAELRRPPKSGTVVVIDRENEEWSAVAPTLHASDAAADGRAIRWMVAAGGPGTGLTDFGEAETSNLATATAMGEQRTRFLKARQAYFGYLLARVGLESYNRAVRLGRVRGKPAQLGDLRIGYTDVSMADNAVLAQGAASVATALRTIYEMGVNGSAFRRLALRLMLQFAGERPDDAALDRLIAGGEAADEGGSGSGERVVE